LNGINDDTFLAQIKVFSSQLLRPDFGANRSGGDVRSHEHTLAPSGADGRESEENARCRVRTCDILRVKQALYH